jgi:hypothetical protein
MLLFIAVGTNATLYALQQSTCFVMIKSQKSTGAVIRLLACLLSEQKSENEKS